METTKTERGWVIETTNELDGMLEQGGVCGRKVLYSMETLAKLGIDYNTDPDEDWNDFVTIEEYLVREVAPDKVLKKGTVIE
ncbi:MAG: hypothetical protein EOM03_16835 [Clostridia bacterium]|nr:hypothetical protein [Clostridia bacterium]